MAVSYKRGRGPNRTEGVQLKSLLVAMARDLGLGRRLAQVGAGVGE